MMMKLLNLQNLQEEQIIQFVLLNSCLWTEQIYGSHLVVSKAEIIQKLAREGIELVLLFNDTFEPARLFTLVDKRGI